MAIENVGPGGVGNNYGVRETVARERYELDKEYIEEYTDTDGKVVTSKVDPVTGGVKTIAVLTQAQYDALPVKDPNTEYNIVAE